MNNNKKECLEIKQLKQQLKINKRLMKLLQELYWNGIPYILRKLDANNKQIKKVIKNTK